MITIVQETTYEYIAKEYVVSISYDKEKREAKVKFSQGNTITYFHVDEIRFN